MSDDLSEADIYRCLLWMDYVNPPLSHRRVVHALLSTPGVVRNSEMLDELYGGDPDGGAETDILKVFVCKIRAWLEGSGFAIVTHWGYGISIVKTEQADRACERIRRVMR